MVDEARGVTFREAGDCRHETVSIRKHLLPTFTGLRSRTESFEEKAREAGKIKTKCASQPREHPGDANSQFQS